MKFMNVVRKFGARIPAAVVGLGALCVGTAHAADESGIITTGLEAIITDGKAKGLVLALAVLGMAISFKIVKKVSSAA